MTLKEIVENNPVLLSLSLLLAGFIAGIGSYDAILRIAHLETISSSELKERDNTTDKLKKEVLEDTQQVSTLTIENKNLSYEVESKKRQLSSDMLAQLDGVWINQNPNTHFITHFKIERRGNDVFVHAWGACHPTDCDWGEERAWIGQDSAVLLWDQPQIAFRKMEIRLNKRTDLTADSLSIHSTGQRSETVEVFNYQPTNNTTMSESSVTSPTPQPEKASELPH